MTVLQPGLPVKPFTLFVNKAAIEGERHGILTWGAAQAGVAAGVAAAVAEGLIPAAEVDFLLCIAAVWVAPGAERRGGRLRQQPGRHAGCAASRGQRRAACQGRPGGRRLTGQPLLPTPLDGRLKSGSCASPASASSVWCCPLTRPFRLPGTPSRGGPSRPPWCASRPTRVSSVSVGRHHGWLRRLRAPLHRHGPAGHRTPGPGARDHRLPCRAVLAARGRHVGHLSARSLVCLWPRSSAVPSMPCRPTPPAACCCHPMSVPRRRYACAQRASGRRRPASTRGASMTAWRRWPPRGWRWDRTWPSSST